MNDGQQQYAPRFDYNALRARQARLGRTLTGQGIVDVFIFIAWMLLAGGLLLALLVGVPVGWLTAGLSGPFFMLWAYSVHELRVLRPDPASYNLQDTVDGRLLARLPDNHTPIQLTEIVASMPGGMFMTTRYGVIFSLIGPALGDRPEDSVKVWAEALRLRDAIQADGIDDAILATALIKTMPDASGYLAVLKLNVEDIDAGLAWYRQVRATIEEHKAHSREAGGIGRDWSFGYTPLLTHFGVNITSHIERSGLLTHVSASHEAMIQQVTQLISTGSRRNAVIVGQLGTGKTVLVQTLAKKLLAGGSDVPPSLRFNQVIALDPSTLIARASGRGELEDLVQHLCYEALTAKNTILFLDDAQLFFEEGNGSVNLSNVLLPMLEGGSLRIILAMDEQRWLQISQTNPALAQYFNRLTLPPASKQETMEIMQNQVLFIEHQHKAAYMYRSLETAYLLSERYSSDQAMPGRAMKLMEAAVRYAEDGLVTPHSVEQALEQMLGVKVSTANTTVERDTLLNLESLIHARMIGQHRAVQVVSDALRRARAGVRNSKRPIGTFLFLGPTGVGKTELAKSVAAVFFGGEGRLVRLDLNEFSGADDVRRLIAEPAIDEHSLTSQITKQPFSVVLLDEIEKAHPNVLNTLLQLLDEGILRDANNREVSFRDAVVVATSNAGADRLRQHIEAGQQLDQFEAQFTSELIDSQVFRPEFLNRFDEIVLFAPLNQDELLQIVDLLIADVNKQLAPQKIAVQVDDDAKRLLVETGYDPRLGARPMRRVVQRAIENIAANQMLTQQVSAGGTVHITLADVQARV